ncbi:MAG: dppC [Microbacterium sp.]|jgi:peptide/nickel transport system permease protein|nr:dppC [Microbacterium sp.]
MTTTLNPQPVTTRRGARNRRAAPSDWLGLIPLFLLVAVAVFGSFVVPYDPIRVVGPPSSPPSADHWFGTDSAGLDVFSRTVAATGLNMMIAALTALLATVLGIALGLISGMNESAKGPFAWLARGLARLIDLMESIPGVILGLVAVSVFGANVVTLILVMGIILCSSQTRLTRTEVLRVRTEAYLDAARMAGDSEARLTFRHVLPNASWAALQNASNLFAISIIVTAALGFIGAGMPPPTPEWGSMLAQGTSDALVGRWWAALAPAVTLTATVVIVSTAANRLLRTPRSK